MTKRQSLADLIPAVAPDTSSEALPDQKRRSPSRREKYPSATVYLPRRAIRIIKEIGLEEDRRISDIISDAVDEYLTKRGHPSIKTMRG